MFIGPIVKPIIRNNKEKKCRRCGRTGMILSNGLCPRCDDVIYGKR